MINVFSRGRSYDCIVGFHVDDLLKISFNKAEADKFFDDILKIFSKMAIHRGTSTLA